MRCPGCRTAIPTPAILAKVEGINADLTKLLREITAVNGRNGYRASSLRTWHAQLAKTTSIIATWEGTYPGWRQTKRARVEVFIATDDLLIDLTQALSDYPLAKLQRRVYRLISIFRGGVGVNLEIGPASSSYGQSVR